MERTYNIIYFFKEIFFHWKWIVLGGVLGTILVCGCLFGIKKIQGDVYSYGSYAEIQVKSNPNFNKMKDFEGIAERDFSEDIDAILLSDAVVKEIEQDEDVASYNLDSESIRNAFYICYDNYGSNVFINVVTNNQRQSYVLCSKLVEHGSNVLISEGYGIQVMQNAVNKGASTIETKELNSGKIHYTLSPTNHTETSWNVSALLKKAVIIYIIVICLLAGLVCFRFLFKEPIISANQIKEDVNIPILGTVRDGNQYDLMKICGNLLFKNINVRTIACISTYGNTNNFYENLKLALADKIDTLNIIVFNPNQFDFKLLNLKNIPKSDDSAINVIRCDDAIDDSFVKLLCKTVDEIILLVGSHSIGMESLKTFYRDLTENGIEHISAVFVER